MSHQFQLEVIAPGVMYTNSNTDFDVYERINASHWLDDHFAIKGFDLV